MTSHISPVLEGTGVHYGLIMRTLVFAIAATLVSSGSAAAADDPVKPFDLAAIDAYFETPAPAFGDLLSGATLSAEGCELLRAATAPTPFEAEPAAVRGRADEYRALARAAPALEPATSAASAALDAAAADGGGRQAMLELWLDRAGIDAIRELTMLAANQCQAEFRWVAFGLADRILELAEHDYPASERLDDVASWSMSHTGQPRTIYWSFGYLGDEPVAVCEELNATLASVGFAGTEVRIFRGDAEGLPDLAIAIVGGSCRPA
ncbi:MAG: hypothetical protein PVG27_08850 [Chloroflexota bacterium]